MSSLLIAVTASGAMMETARGSRMVGNTVLRTIAMAKSTFRREGGGAFVAALGAWKVSFQRLVFGEGDWLTLKIVLRRC